MNTIYAEYNMYHNSIDIYTSAGYMLRYILMELCRCGWMLKIPWKFDNLTSKMSCAKRETISLHAQPTKIYTISILISSIILLSLNLWISVRVIKNTIPIKTNIPPNNAAHGIWYNTGKAFRMDKLIKNGIAIPSITPGTSAFRTLNITVRRSR